MENLFTGLISSKTRIKLLIRFFFNPKTRSYLRELAKEFNVSTNAVREELNQLTRTGLLTSQKSGRQVFYKANQEHPLFAELKSMVGKVMGIDQVVDGIVTRLGEKSVGGLVAIDFAGAVTVALGGATGSLDALVNDLTDGLVRPSLLVLDDYHLVSEAPLITKIVDRLIGYAPAELHIVLAGRHPPSLPGLIAWRARGELLKIDHKDMAFTPDEVSALFNEQYGHQLTPDEVQLLVEKTEGWAIALQLIWQGLRSGVITDVFTSFASSARFSFVDITGDRHSLDDLFAYLAQEVLDREIVRGFSSSGLYRRRLRYFVDGLAVGTEEFIRDQIERMREDGRYRRRKNPIPQLGGIHLSLREQRSSAFEF